MSIEIKNLSKNYGQQLALHRVNFTLNRGEIVGFLGPNGAGKSTLMKILVGYLDPTDGNVSVNGVDVSKDPLEAQRNIGYLPENNPLYTEMYIREYLGFLAAIRKVPKARIPEVIERTGLKPELGKKIEQLSKGYRQRVGLAGALLHDPQVLVLDEPTTGLDPNQLMEIRALIKEVGTDKTVLFSSHIMQEVEALCDRVIVIDKGRILADKPLKDLQTASHQILEVTFQHAPEKELLAQLPHLANLQTNDGLSFILEFKTEKDMRPKVFELATDKGLVILQLNARTRRLEELFRELTANSA
jgi:ABC-2 type transport system ATP-binding protein